MTSTTQIHKRVDKRVLKPKPRPNYPTLFILLLYLTTLLLSILLLFLPELSAHLSARLHFGPATSINNIHTSRLDVDRLFHLLGAPRSSVSSADDLRTPKDVPWRGKKPRTPKLPRAMTRRPRRPRALGEVGPEAGGMP